MWLSLKCGDNLIPPMLKSHLKDQIFLFGFSLHLCSFFQAAEYWSWISTQAHWVALTNSDMCVLKSYNIPESHFPLQLIFFNFFFLPLFSSPLPSLFPLHPFLLKEKPLCSSCLVLSVLAWSTCLCHCPRVLRKLPLLCCLMNSDQN